MKSDDVLAFCARVAASIAHVNVRFAAALTLALVCLAGQIPIT